MKFVDVVSVTVIGGDGGKGFSSFDRKKFMPNGGPNGGDGGKGGDVFLRVNPSFKSLLDLKIKAVYRAQNGNAGESEKKAGKDGKDLYLEVPKGCIITDDQGNVLADLCEDNSCVMVAKGGIGGLGNSHFASARFQAPTYAQPGKPGENNKINIELRLIADVAFVGFPNAGKSSLLAALTDAQPKIGNYAFTTLRPNLGVLKFIDQHITLADMPGLIEGAYKGAGLGHDFLRHISRASCLVHVIHAEQNEQVCYENYCILMNELKASRYCVSNKPSFVVISKSDMLMDDDIKRIRSYFRKKGVSELLFVSIYDKRRLSYIKSAIQKLVTKL